MVCIVYCLFAQIVAAASIPDAARGVVLVSSSVGVVYAIFTSTGLLKWRLGAGASASACALSSSNVAYFCAGSAVFAVDVSSGTSYWTAPAQCSTMPPLGLL